MAVWVEADAIADHEGVPTGAASNDTRLLPTDDVGDPSCFGIEVDWPSGGDAALRVAVPEPEADGVPEEAISGVECDGVIGGFPVAVTDDVSSLGGAIALLPPDVPFVDEGDEAEFEPPDVAVLCVGLSDKVLSYEDDAAEPLPPDVPLVDEGDDAEVEPLDVAVLCVGPFDLVLSDEDDAAEPLPPDVPLVNEGDEAEVEPPDVAVLCVGLFDEVLSDEGDAAEVEPEPDVVASDEVGVDDVLCDGLGCGEGAVYEDDPDEVVDGE